MSILPLNCFPSIHWLCEAMAQEVVVDTGHHYVKQTYRNRFDILGVNGKIPLTIPVQGQKGIKIPMKEIVLADGNWRRLHLRSIRSAYGRAAFFEHYYDGIEKIFNGRQSYLVDFNYETLEFVDDVLSAKFCTLVSASGSYRSDEGLLAAFEPSAEWPALPEYPQVFSDRFGFVSGLSVIDLVMNRGPRSVDYLLLLKNGRAAS